MRKDRNGHGVGKVVLRSFLIPLLMVIHHPLAELFEETKGMNVRVNQQPGSFSLVIKHAEISSVCHCEPAS